MKSTIKITFFKVEHQQGIDEMMQQIAAEFPRTIFTPTSKKIIDVAGAPNNQFWVTLDESKIIGTIGLKELSNHSIVLKSMFLASDFRGLGVGKLLLETLEQWCAENKKTTIYLGTMTQFRAGQQFYERNQFKRIDSVNLPKDFPLNPLDTIFYKKVF